MSETEKEISKIDISLYPDKSPLTNLLSPATLKKLIWIKNQDKTLK